MVKLKLKNASEVITLETKKRGKGVANVDPDEKKQKFENIASIVEGFMKNACKAGSSTGHTFISLQVYKHDVSVGIDDGIFDPKWKLVPDASDSNLVHLIFKYTTMVSFLSHTLILLL